MRTDEAISDRTAEFTHATMIVPPALAHPLGVKLGGGAKVARRAGGEVGIILVPFSPSVSRTRDPRAPQSAPSVEGGALQAAGLPVLCWLAQQRARSST